MHLSPASIDIHMVPKLTTEQVIAHIDCIKAFRTRKPGVYVSHYTEFLRSSHGRRGNRSIEGNIDIKDPYFSSSSWSNLVTDATKISTSSKPVFPTNKSKNYDHESTERYSFHHMPNHLDRASFEEAANTFLELSSDIPMMHNTLQRQQNLLSSLSDSLLKQVEIYNHLMRHLTQLKPIVNDSLVAAGNSILDLTSYELPSSNSATSSYPELPSRHRGIGVPVVPSRLSRPIKSLQRDSSTSSSTGSMEWRRTAAQGHGEAAQPFRSQNMPQRSNFGSDYSSSVRVKEDLPFHGVEEDCLDRFVSAPSTSSVRGGGMREGLREGERENISGQSADKAGVDIMCGMRALTDSHRLALGDYKPASSSSSHMTWSNTPLDWQFLGAETTSYTGEASLPRETTHSLPHPRTRPQLRPTGGMSTVSTANVTKFHDELNLMSELRRIHRQLMKKKSEIDTTTQQSKENFVLSQQNNVRGREGSAQIGDIESLMPSAATSSLEAAGVRPIYIHPHAFVEGPKVNEGHPSSGATGEDNWELEDIFAFLSEGSPSSFNDGLDPSMSVNSISPPPHELTEDDRNSERKPKS